MRRVIEVSPPFYSIFLNLFYIAKQKNKYENILFKNDLFKILI